MTTILTISPARSKPSRVSHSAFRASAFTIMEVIVVVGIIVLLVAILIPAIGYARKVANKSANTAQLSAIQSGLQQYYSDFTMYPSSTGPAYATPNQINQYRGPALLAQALMGYLAPAADGAGNDGSATYGNDPHLGFRTRNIVISNVPQGKVYGPYVTDDPKGFKINLPATAATFPTDAAFIDIFGHEILYFRSTQQGVNGQTSTPTQIFGTAANAYFIDNDNWYDYTGTALKYTSGATANLPDVAIPSPLTPTNAGPTTLFFQNLANRPNNSLLTGSGPVMGANSFILICSGEDGNPYTDDDIIVTNR